ncbi:MAG: sulfatase [Rikenellaceae bacterium]
MKINNLLLLGATATTTTSVLAAQPNIILIMADDLGSGNIGCYGSDYIDTPNIDRLAAEGIKFTDYHTNGSVSSPTRAALMTGRYQQRCGIDMVISAANHRHVGVPQEEYTLAEAFKDQGYTTAIFGKWHLGYAEKFNPIHQGFDHFEGYVAGNVDYHSHLDLVNIHDWKHGTEEVREEGYTTDLITAKAVKFIEEHQSEPFFLYVPHEAPHSPLQGRNSPIQRYEEGATKDTTKVETKSKKELYKEMIEVLDEGVGSIIDRLESLGLAENTIVIFTSDNGATQQGSNAPYRGTKGTFFEGGHRVPFIVWSPGATLAPTAPYTYDSTVISMDLLPTLISMVGGELPKSVTQRLDGIDILPHLLKGKALPSRDLYWNNSSGWSAMRSGNWKFVKNKDISYLFDLSTDVAESKNLAGIESKKAVAMSRALVKWRERVTPAEAAPLQ